MNALIPLVAYLCRTEGKFPNEDAIRNAVNWLYAALMWSRYTGQTDQRLEADVAIIAKEAQPWNALCDQIIDQRGRIKVEASDFAGRGVQIPFYRAAYILAKTHNAVDWFNGLPLSRGLGRAYGLQNHHIFFQSLLYRSSYNDASYTDRQVVNEIANRAFLTASGNWTASDIAPEVYLPSVEENFPGFLAS